MSVRTDAPDIPSRVRLGTVGSTNDEAARLAEQGAADGTLVTAEIQTAGRGRRSRDWHSPRGNLYLSLIARPACAPHRASQLSFAAAVALGDALSPLLPAGVEVAYKWPNDVLLNGRKAAGLLLEASTVGERVAWVVVGVGVNVANHPESVGEGALPATSLAAAGARATPEDVAEAFAARFAMWRGRWETEGFEPVRAAWLARAFGLGRRVTVNLDGERFEGDFEAIDADGALLAALPSGERRRVTAAQVFFPWAA